MTFLLIMNLVIMKHHNVMQQGVELKMEPFLCISHLILQRSRVHHFISVMLLESSHSCIFPCFNGCCCQYRTISYRIKVVETVELSRRIRVIVSSL